MNQKNKAKLKRRIPLQNSTLLKDFESKFYQIQYKLVVAEKSIISSTLFR